MNEKNKSFMFGIVTAVAVVAVIGWIVTAMGNKGQIKVEDNVAIEKDVENSDNKVSQINIEVTKQDHVRGSFDAPVTIVEFSDFQCPYCSRFHATMQEISAKYPDKVRWVYKHFPLDSLHPNARPAAEASECASEQGKFWEFADELIKQQKTLGGDTYKSIASGLGLDMGQFNECVSSGKYKGKVNADYQLGVKSGVRGTPGNFINGKLYPGALPTAQIESIINAL